MRRSPLRNKRVLALSLALNLGLPPAWAAIIVRPKVGTAPTSPVTVIPGGALGSLGGGAKTGITLNGIATLEGALPSLNGPGSVAAHNPAVQSHTAVQPLRKSLRTALEALQQDRKASRKKPGLANLGSAAAAPSKDTGLADQYSAADRYFRQKAGFANILGHNDLPQSEDFLFHAFSPESADPKKAHLQLDGDVDPIYPSRRIRFNGTSFPSVAFRPDRPIQTEIIKAIDATKKSIHVALYEFKNREILKALRRAKARGVEIHVLIDAGHANPVKRPDNDYWPHRSLELQALVNEGFEIRVLRGLWLYGIMHNKTAVFDGKLALFGSYNWSYTSERNHWENINFTSEKKRIKGILKTYEYLTELSVPFADALENKWPNEVRAPPQDTAPSLRFNGKKFPAWVNSPGGEGERWVLKALRTAKKSIDISMFTYRSTIVSEELLKAKKRGVKVRILLDESQTRQDFQQPYAQWLAFHGIEVKTIAGPNPTGPQWAEKNHNKFVVLDGKFVETGSMNWTKSGFLMNFEGAFFLDNKADTHSFQMFFNDMFTSRRATRVVPPGSEPALPTEEELESELRKEPPPLPPAPVWDEMPAPHQLTFNREKFPSSVVRPNHPIKDLLVKAIDSSRKTIHLALYEFTLPEVLEALRRAKKRGLDIRIIIDYSHAFPKGVDSKGEERAVSPEIQALMDEGFDVSVLRGVKSQGIMHHKIGLFDEKMVTFGSYNWAVTAEENHFESVKFETEKERVAYYKKLWEWMRGYAVLPGEAPDHKWNKEWKHGQKAGRTIPIDEDLALTLNGEAFPRTVASPMGMAEETLIRAIRAAKATIDIAMFSFYSARIAEELLHAKERGAHVRITFDRMQSKLMKLDDWFAYYGFDVRIVPGPNPYGNVYYEKNHNKFMIVDGQLLETGSYNFTGNAEENSYENLNFYNDKVEIAFFTAYFQMLYDIGWTPLMPDAPPEGLPSPAEFFSPNRLAEIENTHGFEF